MSLSPGPRSSSNPPTSTTPADPTVQSYTHQCFICLLNDVETPDQPFVNPCPCTLEAHEACLLRWVAESEANRTQSSASKIKCPACGYRIRVDEPHDAVVAVRDGISRGFRRASPYVLLGLMVGGGAVASGWYGLVSAHLFAGPAATARWLGLQTLVNRRPNVPMWRWAPMWQFTAKIWALTLVGPALTIGRAIPAVGNLLLVPTSLMSAALLVAWDDMPTWPPSPAWAVTLFPFVSLTYSNVYYEFFGSFERRLNRALRARPAEEEREAAPRQGNAGGAAEGQGQGEGEGQQGEEEHHDHGVWGAIWGLGQALVGVFRDQEVVLEAEVVPRRHAHGDVELEIEFGEEEFDDEEAEVIVERMGVPMEVARVAAMEAAMEEEAARQQDPATAGQDDDVRQPQDEADPAPAPAPVVAPAARQQNEAQQARPAAQNNNDNDDVQGGDNNRAVGATLTDIMSSIVLSLLYPSICFGMGEMLRVTLPRSWVTRPAGTSWGGRPPATGLLQRRWGRSLVGGCLYVVLKDAFSLYAKYRQVQQKSKRRVRNVERRREGST